MSLRDKFRVLLEDTNAVPRKLLRTWYLRGGRSFNRSGIDIFAEDWDNLVVLDACRFDAFRHVCAFEGTLRKVESRGATSEEFIRGNFTERTAYDTVYVSANGYFDLLSEEIDAEVHDFVPLYQDEYRDAAGGLTTHPETVTKRALEADKEYPHKRLMVHYLQPHQPYLGSFACKHIDHGHGLNIVTTRNQNRDLTDADLWRAYLENLELVLGEVARLLGVFEGKTVITADHGELLGERLPLVPVKDYDHWYGIHVPELLDVPWFEFDGGQRKEIRAEQPDERNAAETEEVERHLADLGYRI
ncbi:hypothetical protein [Haladaptatus sp. NG-SE-30]